MNYLPTQEQFDTVIKNLEKAQEIAGGDAPVDMDKERVYYDRPCGTPMCHAGWYALATTGRIFRKLNSYSSGVEMMAKHLGFSYGCELTDWADGNPHIWGNKYGYLMFSFDSAFTEDESIKIPNLQYIIDHWKGVKQRAQAISLQELLFPTNNSITNQAPKDEQLYRIKD